MSPDPQPGPAVEAEQPAALEVELIPPFYIALQAAILTSTFAVHAAAFISRFAAAASVFLYRSLFVLIYLGHELVRLAAFIRAQALARQEQEQRKARECELFLQRLLEAERATCCDRSIQTPSPEPLPRALLDRTPSPSPGTPEPEPPAALQQPKEQPSHQQLRTRSPATPEPEPAAPPQQQQPRQEEPRQECEQEQEQEQQPSTPPPVDKLPQAPRWQQSMLAARQEEQMLQLNHLWQRAKERASQQLQKRAPATAVLQDAVPVMAQRQQWAQQWWQLQHELQHKQGHERVWRQLLTLKRRA